MSSSTSTSSRMDMAAGTGSRVELSNDTGSSASLGYGSMFVGGMGVRLRV